MRQNETPQISTGSITETFVGAGIMASAVLLHESELEVLTSPTARLVAGMAVGSVILGHGLFRMGRQTHDI